MAQNPDIKIRISNLTKQFDGKAVLQNLDLDIQAGKSTVLIGGAASGKSVLMKCIVGLYTIEGGSIEIDGRDLADMGTSERVELIDKQGVLLQQNGLFDSLPVWENIAFKLLNVRGFAVEEAREVAFEKLGQVGLAPRVADLFPSDLSGGMQKRVGLARALADDPEILLLDNPTAGLDPIMTNEISRLVQAAVAKLGATVLAITSDMKAARRYFDRLAMLHDGKIIWEGPTSEVDAADNPYLDQLINGRSQGPIDNTVQAVAS